jgi:hypothetical protein
MSTHHTLLNEDTASAILQHCDRPTAAVLARTCRAFTETALDIVWEDPPLWELAQRMDESLWTVTPDVMVLFGRQGTYSKLVGGYCSPFTTISLMRIS